MPRIHNMKIISVPFLALLILCNEYCFSQTDDEKPAKKKSKFQTGLYLGSFFANKYTSSLYDGYGYDADGKKNDFVNFNNINNGNYDGSSFMYRKIIVEYGGNYGQTTDQVALALGVDPGKWTFDQTDMPLKMKYTPTIMVGLQWCFTPTKKDAILLNVNATKLTISGDFTIVLTEPVIGNTTPGYENIKSFAITGTEERLIFQPGYRRILGDDDVFNFFIEGGPSLNMTKYMGNSATINNLRIDLGSYYSQPTYPTYHPKYLQGIGLGVFAGLGLNIVANANWNVQLLYSPSYEKINIGEDPKLRLQHAIGLRTFYTL
jgi:hypothetical protein